MNGFDGSLDYLVDNWFSGKPFDSRLEYLVDKWLSGKSATTDIEKMVKDNDKLCFREIALGYLYRDDLLSLTHMTRSSPIPFTKPQVKMILDYYNFTSSNGNTAEADSMRIHNLSPIVFLICFIDDPEQWATEDFEEWKQKGQPNSFVAKTASFAGTETTTTVPKIGLNEEEITSNEIRMKIALTTTAVRCMENNSKEEETVPKNVSSNLNGVPVTTADVVDDDNINNAKSPPKCKNSIGDLDGIKDEYYQADGKYCSIYDSSNDDPPSLPPESPAYTTNIPCIHSNIPNDGEILLLPLISSVYRVEQSNNIDNVKSSPECKNSIGDLNGIKDEYHQVKANNKDDEVTEQSNEVNTLINEVNEEYLFWRPHRDEEYAVEEKPETTTTASVIHTELTKTGSSDLIDVVTADAAVDLYANDLAITDPGVGVVPNEDANSVLIADDDNDNNLPPLPPGPNLPCIHSIIKEVNEEFQFWNDISNEELYGNNDYTCNDTVPNQANNNNRPIDGESKIVLLRSSEHLDCNQIKVSIEETNTNDTVLENVRQYQYRRLNTLIEEVNEEYRFWRPHRLVSNKDVTLNQIRTKIAPNENVVISNLNVAAAAATDDHDEIHSRDEEYPDEEDHHKELVGVLDGTRQDILNIESNIDSNNYDDKSEERIVLPSSVS